MRAALCRRMKTKLDTLHDSVEIFSEAVTMLCGEYPMVEIETSLRLARAALLDAVPVLKAPVATSQPTIDRAFVTVALVAAFLQHELAQSELRQPEEALAHEATLAVLDSFRPFIGAAERAWLKQIIGQPFYGAISRLS